MPLKINNFESNFINIFSEPVLLLGDLVVNVGMPFRSTSMEIVCAFRSTLFHCHWLLIYPSMVRLNSQELNSRTYAAKMMLLFTATCHCQSKTSMLWDQKLHLDSHDCRKIGALQTASPSLPFWCRPTEVFGISRQ